MGLKYTTPTMKNLTMNEGVYLLRRRVMSVIYEARRLIELPRINVRITENDTEKRSVLGRAQIGGEVIIWIPLKAFNLSDNDFKFVVYHEIMHTAYNRDHKEHGLMTATIQKGLSSEEIDKLLIEEANAEA